MGKAIFLGCLLLGVGVAGCTSATVQKAGSVAGCIALKCAPVVVECLKEGAVLQVGGACVDSLPSSRPARP